MCRSSVNRLIRYASVQNRFWRERFNIVAFICSLLQYFIAVVCFALQPFTISAERAKFKEVLVNFGLERNEATSDGQAF
jgi:hypothetical protein